MKKAKSLSDEKITMLIMALVLSLCAISAIAQLCGAKQDNFHDRVRHELMSH